MNASSRYPRSDAPHVRIPAVALLAGAEGPEPWTLEASPPGAWRFEVSAFEGQVTPGRYAARIDEVITASEHAERRAKARYRSPRLVQLAREHRAGGAAAIARFAEEMEGRAPLVEPVAGDPRGDVLVTFLWRGASDTHSVGLVGGPVGPSNESPMLRFEDTDLWYLTVRTPKDLRILYRFVPGEPPDAGATLEQRRHRHSPFQTQADPWNPRRHQFRSLLELPGAPPQPWAQRAEGVPAGRVVEATIHSENLGEDRKLGVYVPSAFDPAAGPYPYVIVFDGEVYGLAPEAEVPTPTLLDNLIAQGKVPPMLAVLLASQATRNRDLPMSARP